MQCDLKLFHWVFVTVVRKVTQSIDVEVVLIPLQLESVELSID